ncbi:MAG: carboxypeptidase regulatory-like domain-containing protein [Acidobacteria bacterium]|nr:carboxypeptidase regulatory-like domain-containing protein [Acidobacteriota bacterium]
MKLSLPFLACAIMLLLGGRAFACSCAGSPSVCESYAGAEAVFIGSVQRVEQAPPVRDEDGRTFSGGQFAHVQVEKLFKGSAGASVVFRTYGTSCDVRYEAGQRWLFYAHYDKEKKVWGIRACGRSTRVENGADDLLYLQGLPASAQRTRLSGKLVDYNGAPLAGIRVKLTAGKKSYEVFTDRNGVYEMYGLPPGSYLVKPDLPLGRTPFFRTSAGIGTAVELPARGCAGLDFYYSADSSVSGKVLDPDGRAMNKVCLSLLPKDDKTPPTHVFDCTDEEGRYMIDEVPPGEYLIVFNDDDEISSDEPFPKGYYPGVFEREKATLITLSAGAKLEDYDIRIPTQEPRRTLQGLLLFEDGRPAAYAFVEFKAESAKAGYSGEVHVTTDAQGRFSLSVLQGLKGRLRGFMSTYAGQYVNCPKLDKLIKEQNGRSLDVGTKPVPVEVTTDVQDLRLVFPFPACAKAKIE